jgi:hypothetical protein
MKRHRREDRRQIAGLAVSLFLDTVCSVRNHEDDSPYQPAEVLPQKA